MREECQNTCTRAVIALKETALSRTIDDFVENAEEISSSPALLSRFYEYIRIKYAVPCESGMLFVERLVMLRLFERFRALPDPQNALVNAKISLYAWLRPAHLGIAAEIPEAVIAAFRRIGSSGLAGAKTTHFMAGVVLLHDALGRDASPDTLFPALVFCLVRSQVRDLVHHIRIMRGPARLPLETCVSGCSHGFSVPVRCNCMFRRSVSSEDEYYLVTAAAALEFIQKLEFYSLRVGVAEFNREIGVRVEQMRIAKNMKTRDSRQGPGKIVNDGHFSFLGSSGP